MKFSAPSMKVFLLALSAALLTRLAIEIAYRLLIVPQLPNLQSVPLFWWLLLLSPMAFILLAIGFSLRSGVALVIFSVILGFLFDLADYLLWVLNQPGLRKEPETLLALAASRIAIVLAFVSVGYLARRIFARSQASILPV